MIWRVDQADCIDWLNSLATDCADMVFGSPPYMDARTYEIDAQRDCRDWVEWMLAVSEAAVRVSRGLVLWVVAGVQRDNCYWPGCEGLAWEWWRRGGSLWRPCVWWKVNRAERGTGLPGSGGKQYLRADWEYVLAFKREGCLPWADPLIMGDPPVLNRLGGEMSNRMADGRRVNSSAGGRKRRQMPPMPIYDSDGNLSRTADGRPFPTTVNPGNVLANLDEDVFPGLIVKARVGGGHIGNKIAHENEAPFPEALAEFFVRSFCLPNGVVLDPFCGSGTTGAVAVRWGRQFWGCDLRESQVELSRRRIAGETPTLFPSSD